MKNISWSLQSLNQELGVDEFPIQDREVRVGRTSDNHIPLPSRNVSRHHASLYVDRSGLLIKDMGSKNGTFVNEERISSRQIASGDIVRIAEFQFRVVGAQGERGEKPRRKSIGPATGASASLGNLVTRMQAFFGKRLLIYALVLGLGGWIVYSEFYQPKAAKPKSVETEAPTKEKSSPALPYQNLSEADIATFSVKADAALQFDDVPTAVFLLRKIVAARPDDMRSKIRLTKAEARLRALIKIYFENGAREFEKLYYDKAIREWRKVLALSTNFDKDFQKRALEKIREAESKIAEK
jgi:pSer/pThr/pTyr-binding forkhead associated (FHA) protein